MRIVPVAGTPSAENGKLVWHAFKNRTVVSCGVAEFPPGFCAHLGEKHVHDHDEVFIILSGEITVPITNGPTGRAGTGDWVLVAAGEEHHLTNHGAQPCIAMYLILKEDRG
jgi:quercetin dioxygenase-like cupin family protein